MTAATSVLAQEIADQPAVLRRFLDRHAEATIDLGRALAADGCHQAVIAARGSSDNAARYAQYVFGTGAGWPVALAAPSLHTRYDAPVSYAHAVVLAVSQSGRSPDVVAVVEAARAQGRPTVALTNAPSSPLADAAEHVIDLAAGDERSVAATKSYTTSLLAFACLSAGISGAPGATIDELGLVPDAVAAAIDAGRGADRAAGVLAGAARSLAIGRGYNLSTAFEIALKVTELTGSACQPYSSADLLHGPIASAGTDTPVIVVAPRGQVSGDVLAAAAEARKRGATPILLSDEPDVLAGEELTVALPTVPEWLSPIVAVTPGQVLAMEAARRRGVEIDTPHGLSKVTETR